MLIESATAALSVWRAGRPRQSRLSYREHGVRGAWLGVSGGQFDWNPRLTQVVGTLVCAAGSATPVVISSPGVSLSLQGEAFFFGNIGTIPNTCNSSNVAFLIEIPATPTARWIANGAVITSP
jgi:hypothetical protein